MPRLPSLSAREVVKAFSKAGYEFERQAGSHVIMFNPLRRQVLSIPNHNPVRRGTLRTLIRQAGLTLEEFVSLAG
jgi:predicted RNA binding protein YcfA (HicA-like mRNA interferase family)